jgi:hypothetical protein
MDHGPERIDPKPGRRLGVITSLAWLSDAAMPVRVLAVAVTAVLVAAALREVARVPWSVTIDAEGLTVAYAQGRRMGRWSDAESVRFGTEMVLLGGLSSVLLPIPLPLPLSWAKMELDAVRFVFRDGRSAKVYLGKVDRAVLDDVLLDVDVPVRDAGRIWGGRL